MKAICTVVGKDKVGIIAGVCTKLSTLNINILDITQTIMQGNFTMIMVVDIGNCNLEFESISDQLQKYGDEQGLSIRIQREDIFTAMHRV